MELLNSQPVRLPGSTGAGTAVVPDSRSDLDMPKSHQPAHRNERCKRNNE